MSDYTGPLYECLHQVLTGACVQGDAMSPAYLSVKSEEQQQLLNILNITVR